MTCPTRSIVTVACGALLAAGCASSAVTDDASASGSPAPPEAAATIERSTPTTTSAIPESTATPSTEVEVTVPPEPRPLRDGMVLTAGWTYATAEFDVPVRFTIPSDVDGRWRVFDDHEWSVASILNPDPRNPEVPGDEQPGLALATVPEGVSVNEMIESMLSWGATEPDVQIDRSTGLLHGEEVQILRGTSAKEGTHGAFVIRTSPESTMRMSYGDRQFIMYVLTSGERVVLAKLEAHPLEFDLIVTNANAVLDSLEFA